MYQPDEETKRKVYEMFDRDNKMVEDDVNIIKTWLKSQNHLPEIMEDVNIRNFLILNKFSIEKTKQKIDMYYTVRSLFPELFENSNPKLENMKEIFKTIYLTFLPKKVDGIHTVYLGKLKVPNTLDPLQWFNAFLAFFEVRLYEDFMVSDIIVMDMATMNFNDFKRITPTLMSKFLTVYKKVYSLRLHSIIFINCPSYVTILTQILKAILKPKIFARIQSHPDHQILKEVFSKDSIPKDYGGDGPSLEELSEILQKKLFDYQERFDRLDRLRVNESLRPTKLDNDEILGYYGNFRKLDVD